jgi:hypothetical protein
VLLSPTNNKQSQIYTFNIRKATIHIFSKGGKIQFYNKSLHTVASPLKRKITIKEISLLIEIKYKSSF